jgi:phage-related protein
LKSPEDSVLKNLQWYREGGEQVSTQRRDVVELLRTNRDRLDARYLELRAPRLGVADLLEKARREAVPPSGRKIALGFKRFRRTPAGVRQPPVRALEPLLRRHRAQQRSRFAGDLSKHRAGLRVHAAMPLRASLTYAGTGITSSGMRVRFYRTASGRVPVAEFLAGLPSGRAEDVYAALLDLNQNGLEGASVVARHIDGKLWELKFAMDRIFYVVIRGPEMVLLHAYKKQGQKAPKTEIETATRRMREVLAE